MGCDSTNLYESQKANYIKNSYLNILKKNIFYNDLELILDFGGKASSITSDEQLYKYLASKSIDEGMQKLIVYFLHQAGGKLKTISNNEKLPMIIIHTFLLFMANSEDPQIKMEKTKVLIYLITSSRIFNNNNTKMVNMVKFVENVENFTEFIMKIARSFLLLIALLPNGFNDLTNLFKGNPELLFSLENSEAYISKIINEVNPKYNYRQLLKQSMKFLFFPLNDCKILFNLNSNDCE